MSLSLITGPTIEPITLQEAKLQLGMSQLQDTDMVNNQMVRDLLRPKIQAAREAAEDYCRRAFVSQQWLLQLDGFPEAPAVMGYQDLLWQAQIYIPKPPLITLDLFQYVDTAGILQTLPLDADNGNSSVQYTYQLDMGSVTQPARVLPGWARPWPPTRLVANNVQITFTAGYGGAPSDISQKIREAIRIALSHFYLNPAGDKPMPQAFYDLLSYDRNLVA